MIVFKWDRQGERAFGDAAQREWRQVLDIVSGEFCLGPPRGYLAVDRWRDKFPHYFVNDGTSRSWSDPSAVITQLKSLTTNDFRPNPVMELTRVSQDTWEWTFDSLLVEIFTVQHILDISVSQHKPLSNFEIEMNGYHLMRPAEIGRLAGSELRRNDLEAMGEECEMKCDSINTKYLSISEPIEYLQNILSVAAEFLQVKFSI